MLNSIIFYAKTSSCKSVNLLVDALFKQPIVQETDLTWLSNLTEIDTLVSLFNRDLYTEYSFIRFASQKIELCVRGIHKKDKSEIKYCNNDVSMKEVKFVNYIEVDTSTLLSKPPWMYRDALTSFYRCKESFTDILFFNKTTTCLACMMTFL